jgi:hypothetical protein
MKKSIVKLINRSSPRQYKGVAQLLIEDEDQEHNIIRNMLSRLNKVSLKQKTAPEDVEILRQHYDKIRRVLSDQTTLKNRLFSVSCCKHVQKSDLMNSYRLRLALVQRCEGNAKA